MKRVQKDEDFKKPTRCARKALWILMAAKSRSCFLNWLLDLEAVASRTTLAAAWAAATAASAAAAVAMATFKACFLCSSVASLSVRAGALSAGCCLNLTLPNMHILHLFDFCKHKKSYSGRI